MSKVTAIIPARSGSKSIPKKNMIDICGFPLIAYSIAAAKLSNKVDEIIVSTDGDELAEISLKYGADVPFLRPLEISGDSSTDIEFVYHYLNYLQGRDKSLPELIVHLRPTSPLRRISVIDDAVKFMQNESDFTALRSMHDTHLTPYKMFKISDEGIAEPFLRKDGIYESYNLPRQRFEQAFIPNGYVDVIRSEVVINTGTLHGMRIKVWPTEHVADIDVVEDVRHADHMLRNKDRWSEILEYLERVS
jgi:CMP-N,N'-diacetyllegionaminic acid synthase